MNKGVRERGEIYTYIYICLYTREGKIEREEVRVIYRYR